MNVNKLIKLRNIPLIKYFVRACLMNRGIDLPKEVVLGKNVDFVHNSFGTVIHCCCKIGNGVKIYQGVTLGRADIWTKETKFVGIEVGDGAIICAGAKVLCKVGILRIGKNSIIGANSVLLNSTNDNEIWAGIPAKLIGIRKDI